MSKERADNNPLRAGTGQKTPQVESVLARVLGSEARFEKIHVIGYGADYRVFGAVADIDGTTQSVAVRLPRKKADGEQPERARRAAEVQRQLAKIELPFDVPQPVGVSPAENGLAVVEKQVDGSELGQCHGKQGVDPVEIVATVASGCHGVDIQCLQAILMGFDSCRAGAEALVDRFRCRKRPEFKRAYRWCRNHLPDDGPTRLLHGDLLVQNILVDPLSSGRQSPPLAVVDWDRCRRGDPARDLAQLTRGYETVFGTGQTRGQLLEAYNQRARSPIDPMRLRFYELVVTGGEFMEHLDTQKTLKAQRKGAEQRFLSNLDAVC